ncbi:MAG: response regulator transcription factor [Haliea sp.]|uniref:response regulator transcription factor n=1 Tax=Haliea sp. TaxID=1932666 RepID=UPI0032EC73EA
MKVLLVEDDRTVADFIVSELARVGHECTHCADGESGLAAARDNNHDVLVVDRMLPRLDGLALLASLRQEAIDTPVLILSALGDVDDRVQGLHCGADDYLVKPFAMAELLARLEILSRRGSQSGSEVPTRLQVADLEMDLLSQEVRRRGEVVNLQPREFRLLEYLMRNAGQVVTRAMLLEHVWGYHFDPQTNVIDVHISRLRQKIDRDFSPPLLATVRGAGDCLGAG